MLVSGQNINLAPLSGLSAVGAGPWTPKGSPNNGIQVNLFAPSGTACTATVVIEVANGDGNMPPTSIWPCDTPAATVTLTGTGAGVIVGVPGNPPNVAASLPADSDGFVMQNSPWRYIRLHVTALTGTGAFVTGTMGI